MNYARMLAHGHLARGRNYLCTVGVLMAAVRKDRNVVDSHHLPEGTHSLAPRPGSLVRLTFQMARRAEARKAKAGPRGRTCTRNFSVLSGTPLHWATRGFGFTIYDLRFARVLSSSIDNQTVAARVNRKSKMELVLPVRIALTLGVV